MFVFNLFYNMGIKFSKVVHNGNEFFNKTLEEVEMGLHDWFDKYNDSSFDLMMEEAETYDIRSRIEFVLRVSKRMKIPGLDKKVLSRVIYTLLALRRVSAGLSEPARIDLEGVKDFRSHVQSALERGGIEASLSKIIKALE